MQSLGHVPGAMLAAVIEAAWPTLVAFPNSDLFLGLYLRIWNLVACLY